MDLGRVSGFYPGGRPSGLPDDIVEQLVNAKKMEELDPLQNKLDSVKQTKDVYSKLDSTLVNMAKSAGSLNSSEAFQAKSVSSSNEDVLTATVDNSAQEGTYNVDVNTLAQAHNHVVGTDGDTDAENPLTDGSEGIGNANDSSLINADMKVSFHHNGSEHSYTTDGETTLSSLADQISEDGNGVSASVRNLGTTDSPEYVLNLKSETTGTGENVITKDDGNPGVDITDTTSSGNTLFTSGAADQEETQSGQNATFSVDGVSFERTSNEVSDAIDGVTLNLLDQGTDVNIGVDKDIGSVTKQVQSFVDTFNQTNGFIEKQSDYNKDTEQAGPLMGSSVARSAESTMTRVLQEPISGTSDDPYQYLTQVGFEFQRDGSLEFDSGKFKSAMEKNPQGVEKLFVGDSGAAGKMENVLKEGFTDTIDGAVNNKIDSIDNRIDRINDRITQEEQDLQNYRERTVQKFSNMEEAIMKYQSIESQLGNWLDLGKDEKA